MDLRRRLRIFLLPLVVLVLQGCAAWGLFRTADAAWGPEPTLAADTACETTLWLFGASGPWAALLLGWGLYATFSRLRRGAAAATTLLYVPALLVSGVASWALGVFLGWF